MTKTSTKTPSNSELRAWARENDFAVSDRGRIPAQVRAAWASQQSQQATPRRRRPAKVTEPAIDQSPDPVMPVVAESTAVQEALAVLQSDLATLAHRVQQLETDLRNGKKGKTKAKVKGKKDQKAKA
jgi:hypothetical protein